MSRNSLIGAHVSVGGGLMKALAGAGAVGAEVVQIFAGNPRGWRNPKADPDGDATFRDTCGEAGLPVYVHAPYLINFGSPSPETLEKSADALRFSLQRSDAIGASGVVLHAGSALIGGDWETAMGRVREHMLPALDHTDTPLLIEPTAGGGGALASDLASLKAYLEFLGRDERIGVCLDTCHLYAAGHDITGTTEMATMLKEAKRVAGKPGIGLIHVNDSRDPLGSKRDRHAALGSGSIGLEPFAALFSSPACAGVPMIVETADDDHAADIISLKKHRDAASTVRAK